MKKLTSGILVSAALLAVSAPMVTNATTVLADTSTSEATMVTVTITNIDTKGNILSSQQHQVKQGSNVDAYPFGEISIPDRLSQVLMALLFQLIRHTKRFKADKY
ncbi:hypothetical protein [Lacticaseibacillus saniviri]|uniref:hypothetical protein n=1 Tax=Lacticaseibacillus saniviri TaxID=931533 RepID=UPI0006CF7A27|nr:hypothetical protein [Lacticaseibacillus saniviri]